MDDQQAKTLGQLLRQRREALGLSSRQLAKLAGTRDTTIMRLERGAFATPAPDKLLRIAEALGLSLADVYALAGYGVPNELPALRPYLRTKYRDLPAPAAAELERYVEQLERKYGFGSHGPVGGEDELPEEQLEQQAT